MAERLADFETADAGGGRLSLADGQSPPGSALVAASLGSGFPALVRLQPHQVRALRDWCNRLLERHAGQLPVEAGRDAG